MEGNEGLKIVVPLSLVDAAAVTTVGVQFVSGSCDGRINDHLLFLGWPFSEFQYCRFLVVGVRKAQSCIHHSYLGAARALIYSRGGELGIRIATSLNEPFGQVIALISNTALWTTVWSRRRYSILPGWILRL